MISYGNDRECRGHLETVPRAVTVMEVSMFFCQVCQGMREGWMFKVFSLSICHDFVTSHSRSSIVQLFCEL
jgi:hypothetical protein